MVADDRVRLLAATARMVGGAVFSRTTGGVVVAAGVSSGSGNTKGVLVGMRVLVGMGVMVGTGLLVRVGVREGLGLGMRVPVAVGVGVGVVVEVRASVGDGEGV